ncbi:MAG: hypothetical protein LBU65_03290 [Planctomycetaceae bacterium]|jgi:hypothetical protein|nr:hypothetical protein [Planctomycetaceae bacterium]
MPTKTTEETMSEEKEYALSDFMDFNPSTPLAKRTVCVKGGMENLTSALPASAKTPFPMLEYRDIFIRFKEQDKADGTLMK